MASSFRPSISSFMLPSLSSCNPSQKFSLFHLGSGIRRFHNFGLKPSKFLRHDDDNCMRAKASGNTSSIAAPENALDWVKHDKRKMLHVVYRVGDLDKTIKFYTECLGMKVLRQRDMQEQRHTNAFLGYGPEDAHFAVELTYNYGIDKYDIGDGFGHFGLAVDDISRIVELVRAKGGKITREPMLVKGGNSVNAFIEDPDGYQFELLERAPSPEPLCKVMLRVCDLDRSIKFYEKAFGMELLRTQDYPESKKTIAILGYGPEEKSTVLELTYNYGVTKYDKGDAYAQMMCTKLAKQLNLQEGRLLGNLDQYLT
ncbi:probable lactoylglutathione lyase, chloroplastic isoform X3 [Vigna radiata var. radiata]|uniref:lactoylglutathione lyase n=1 Tax=Vigna radiata var. radiata TaxID=3916 RepID=A0A1S3UJB1_VIGRR|nr:probable lactoylglutathione lyase, chloroplastic isoform X3 [Vigna radiata var. radiata]